MLLAAFSPGTKGAPPLTPSLTRAFRKKFALGTVPIGTLTVNVFVCAPSVLSAPVIVNVAIRVSPVRSVTESLVDT